MDLFLFLRDARQDQAELRSLVVSFAESLPVWGMADLLAVQTNYARNLAASPRALEYEEMHKLFSLCDEIFALRELGLTAAADTIEELDSALHARFAAEPRKSRLVAEDRAENWNRDLWWYGENLRGT